MDKRFPLKLKRDNPSEQYIEKLREIRGKNVTQQTKKNTRKLEQKMLLDTQTLTFQKHILTKTLPKILAVFTGVTIISYVLVGVYSILVVSVLLIATTLHPYLPKIKQKIPHIKHALRPPTPEPHEKKPETIKLAFQKHPDSMVFFTPEKTEKPSLMYTIEKHVGKHEGYILSFFTSIWLLLLTTIWAATYKLIPHPGNPFLLLLRNTLTVWTIIYITLILTCIALKKYA